MKKLLFLILLLSQSYLTFSQELLLEMRLDSTKVVTYNEQYAYVNKVFTTDNPKLFLVIQTNKENKRILEFTSTEPIAHRKEGYERAFYEKGIIKSIYFYKDGKPADKFVEYYDNEQKKVEGYYKGGKLYINNFWTKDGVQLIIDGNGILTNAEFEDYKYVNGAIKDGLKTGIWTGKTEKNLVTNEKFKKGKLIEGVAIDNNKIATNYDKEFVKAEPISGWNSFYEALSTELKDYTTSETGKIKIQLIIDKEGNVSEKSLVLQGFSEILNAKAFQIINRFKFKPCLLRGQPNSIVYLLPLTVKNSI